MEVQSECVEPPPPPPPCDPQPPGKINKAAFKLFGKRRSGMAGFFSFRNKGVNRNGNSLVRSKTHDGLTSLEPDGQRGEESGISEAGQVKSLSKSLSFFSLLRRGSVRANENTGFGRRGRGLKGFFSSMKWRRKENVTEGEGAQNTESAGTSPSNNCDPPSEPSVDRLCSVLFTDVTSLKSFDSLTGCGDIIADAEEEGAGNGGGGGESPSGSGVVAYMGGGEEMASPDGVDDADMQGLWHMLPSGGENSPTFLRSNSHLAPPRGTERKLTQKETKEEVPPQQDVPALRDEGYWDTPSATPTATPDNGFLRNQRLGLLCDSCSGDALYDLYNEELERSDDEEEEEDLMSTPSTSACDTSLPRESKIPLSVRQTTPPHSVSQSALSSVHATAPPSDTPTHAPPPARTRIPVSKVPVRRPGNKAGNATQGPAPRK
uniref:APC membrane recruitment protein 2 n=1 Tax=Salmo trutta TaxID=8032 RepID=A0A674AHS6_SALTR